MAKRKVNRSNLVRDALGKGITKPSDIVANVQQVHGVAVSKALIQKIKRTQGKTKQRKKLGPKPVAATSTSGPKPKAVASSNGSAATLSIQDITTVKGLLTRLGRDGVEELIAVLA
jgi:hypothetical protein